MSLSGKGRRVVNIFESVLAKVLKKNLTLSDNFLLFVRPCFSRIGSIFVLFSDRVILSVSNRVILLFNVCDTSDSFRTFVVNFSTSQTDISKIEHRTFFTKCINFGFFLETKNKILREKILLSLQNIEY